MQMWGIDNGVTFQTIDDFLSSISEDDKTIDIHIHCRGGNVIEGWAIYDALRHSGKEISATIDGECSSMATIVSFICSQRTAESLHERPFLHS